MRKSFTLIELLVVIGIVGILAAVIVAGVAQSRAKARDSRRVADINLIAQKLSTYMYANKTYPDDCDDDCANPNPNFNLFENDNFTSTPGIREIRDYLEQNAAGATYYYMCKREQTGATAERTIISDPITVTIRPNTDIEPVFFAPNPGGRYTQNADYLNDADVDTTYLDLLPSNCAATMYFTIKVDGGAIIPEEATVTSANVHFHSQFLDIANEYLGTVVVYPLVNGQGPISEYLEDINGTWDENIKTNMYQYNNIITDSENDLTIGLHMSHYKTTCGEEYEGPPISTSQIYIDITYTTTTVIPASDGSWGTPDCSQYILKACLEAGGGSNITNQQAFKIENSVNGAIIPQNGPACP